MLTCILKGEVGQGLSDSVRKYRQSVFKLNYKIKKNAGRSQAANRPAIPATAAARMAAASARFKADCAEGVVTTLRRRFLEMLKARPVQS